MPNFDASRCGECPGRRGGRKKNPGSRFRPPGLGSARRCGLPGPPLQASRSVAPCLVARHADLGACRRAWEMMCFAVRGRHRPPIGQTRRRQSPGTEHRNLTARLGDRRTFSIAVRCQCRADEPRRTTAASTGTVWAGLENYSTPIRSRIAINTPQFRLYS